jgi:hypothetical protein
MAQQTKNSTAKRNSRSSPSSGSRSGATRSPNGRSGAARARSRTTSKRSNGSRSTASKRASSSASSRRRSSRQSRPESGKSPVSSATETASKAGSALGDMAQKAKVPALAAGVGLAGLAGGVALAGHNSRRRVLGVPVPTKSGTQAVSKSLAEATKNVRSFGEGMESLAGEVRKVREGFVQAGAANAGGNAESRRSPIEVVLQGLTRRR